MAPKKKAAKRAAPGKRSSTDATLEAMSLKQQVQAIERRCLGPMREGYRERITRALNAGKEAEARQLGAEGREGCGYDINELILSEPLDGKDHAAPCPGCGQEIKWRAPS